MVFRAAEPDAMKCAEPGQDLLTGAGKQHAHCSRPVPIRCAFHQPCALGHIVLSTMYRATIQGAQRHGRTPGGAAIRRRCIGLNDHERKTMREVERQFQAEDPEFTRSFDTRAQRLRRRPADSGRAALITPMADRLRKVDMQIITQPVPAQDGITLDNVTVRVDAVLYYGVVDPVRVAVDVQDYRAANLQVAGWGVHIDRVEIKDVALPESMNRSMSRQAEANANGAPG
jgi:hypothetical protein